MRLIRRIIFAIRFNIEPEFIVYSIPEQMGHSFINHDDAIRFSNSQAQYSPKIMVSVEKLR